jgi:hypothetical protein
MTADRGALSDVVHRSRAVVWVEQIGLEDCGVVDGLDVVPHAALELASRLVVLVAMLDVAIRSPGLIVGH